METEELTPQTADESSSPDEMETAHIIGLDKASEDELLAAFAQVVDELEIRGIVESPEPSITELTHIERERIYFFPGGDTVSVQNVTAFGTRGQGHTHRLETADGHKLIIAPHWLAIELDTDGWSL